MCVLRNVISGYLSVFRKSAERRCASRCGSWVSMLAASMRASTCERSGRASSSVSVPAQRANRPCTFEMTRCRTANPIFEWARSMSHVVWVRAVALIVLMKLLLCRYWDRLCDNTHMLVKKKPSVFRVEFFAQARQRDGLGPREPARNGAVERRGRGRHALDQLQSAPRDARDRVAPVLVGAGAPDQAAALEPVDHAGEIGRPLDHAPGDLAARVSGGVRALEDAQHVVLRRTDVVLLEQPRGALLQERRRHQQVEHRLVHRAFEAVLDQTFAERGGHDVGLDARGQYVLQHILSPANGMRSRQGKRRRGNQLRDGPGASGAGPTRFRAAWSRLLRGPAQLAG